MAMNEYFGLDIHGSIHISVLLGQLLDPINNLKAVLIFSQHANLAFKGIDKSDFMNCRGTPRGSHLRPRNGNEQILLIVYPRKHSYFRFIGTDSC